MKPITLAVVAAMAAVFATGCNEDDSTGESPEPSGQATPSEAGDGAESEQPGEETGDQPGEETGEETGGGDGGGNALGFLTADDFPPYADSGWSASEVTEGLPEAFTTCYADVFNSEGAAPESVSYHTELDAQAAEVIDPWSEADGASALDLQAHLNDAIAGCADSLEGDDPAYSATYEELGVEHVGEFGVAHLHALYVSYEDAGSNVHLFAVGNNPGNGHANIMLLQWGQLGGPDDAPIDDFRNLATTAIEQL